MDVARHHRLALRMNRTQIRILEQTDQVFLRSDLQSLQCEALPSHVVARHCKMAREDFTYKTLEREAGNQEIRLLLILAYFLIRPPPTVNPVSCQPYSLSRIHTISARVPGRLRRLDSDRPPIFTSAALTIFLAVKLLGCACFFLIRAIRSNSESTDESQSKRLSRANPRD